MKQCWRPSRPLTNWCTRTNVLEATHVLSKWTGSCLEAPGGSGEAGHEGSSSSAEHFRLPAFVGTAVIEKILHFDTNTQHMKHTSIDAHEYSASRRTQLWKKKYQFHYLTLYFCRIQIQNMNIWVEGASTSWVEGAFLINIYIWALAKLYKLFITNKLTCIGEGEASPLGGTLIRDSDGGFDWS